MRATTLISALSFVFLFTSCRDKGEYAYSGFLLDSCGVNPIALAEVIVYAGQDGDRKTTTDANGYFRISGEWNEKGGLMHKTVFPEMVVRTTQGYPIIQFEYLPEGSHDFGTTSISSFFSLPVIIDTSNYGCASCKYTFYISQKGSIYHARSSHYLPDSSQAGLIEVSMPLAVTADKKTLSKPMFLSFFRKDSVSVSYPEIDITNLVRACEMGDTLVIKL